MNHIDFDRLLSPVQPRGTGDFFTLKLNLIFIVIVHEQSEDKNVSYASLKKDGLSLFGRIRPRW